MAQLRDALSDWQRTTTELGALCDPRQTEVLKALRETTVQRTAASTVSNPLTMSDREAELEEWLEDSGIEPAWEFAPVLVSFGWDRDELERITGPFSTTQRPIVLRCWGRLVPRSIACSEKWERVPKRSRRLSRPSNRTRIWTRRRSRMWI